MANDAIKQAALRELARRELTRRQDAANQATTMDVAKSAQSGIADAAAGTVDGMPKQMVEGGQALSGIGRQLMPNIMGPVFDLQDKALGAMQGITDMLPGAEDVRPMLPQHTPETGAGQLAETAGRLSANALAPGGIARKAAMVAVPALASEAAGAMTKGTVLEGPARMGAEILGSMGAAGLKSTTLRTLKEAAQTAQYKTGNEMKAAANAAYDQLRDAGFQYNIDDYTQLLNTTRKNLQRRGMHPSVAKEAHALIDDMIKNPQLDFGALDAQSSALGQTIRGQYKQGNDTNAAALQIIKENLDNFAVNPTFAPTAKVKLTNAEAAEMRRDARALVLRKKKAELIEDMISDANDSTSGFATRLNTRIATELRKGKNSLFNDGEKQLMRSVMVGKEAWQKLPLALGAVDPTGIAGGTAIRIGDLAKTGMEPKVRKRAEDLAGAMRNEDLGKATREAERQQRSQALRRLMGLGTAVLPDEAE